MSLKHLLVISAVGWSAATTARADEFALRPQNVTVEHDTAEDVPVLGPRYAPVTMDFFMRFTRHDMKAYRNLGKLAARHPRRLRIVIRVLPSNGHMRLDEAVMEAYAQGQFFAVMDAIADDRGRIPVRSVDKLEELCKRVGVDFRRVDEAWQSNRHERVLERNELYQRRRRAPSRALTLLVNGVPSSLRNSEITLARLEKLYDNAYASARLKLDHGVSIEHIYQLSLLEADADIKPIRINAGGVSGTRRPPHRGVLDEAPLVDPELPSGGYLMGSPTARVTVHFYCDFLLRYRACRETSISLDELRSYYPGVVRVFFHHMAPEGLDEDEQRQSLLLSSAALCADAQGKFEDFYRASYRSMRPRNRSRAVTAMSHLDKVREKLDLDEQLFRSCMEDPATAENVISLIRASKRAGIAVSPTVVLGGRMYPGSKTTGELQRLVEIELMPGLLEQFAPDVTGSDDWFEDLVP